MFAEMPKGNSDHNRSHPTPLRRSPRFLHHRNVGKQEEPSIHKLKLLESQVRSAVLALPSVQNSTITRTPNRKSAKFSKKCSKSKKNSDNFLDAAAGLRRSPRLNNGVDGFSRRRRSPRFCNSRVVDNAIVYTVKKFAENDLRSATKSKCKDKSAKLDKEKGEVVVNLGKETVSEKERKRSSSCPGSLREQSNCKVVANSGENKIGCAADRSQKESMVKEVNGRKGEVCKESSDGNAKVSERMICLGLKALVKEDKRDVSRGENVEIGVKRKRKPCKELRGVLQGWTKEQEVALQRAYYSTKPTPHFWKKVSKLVPGKSAQECFDRINSDHITPPQPQPRSRANKISSVSIEKFSLSASKLLKPEEVKIKRSSFSKQRDHGAWKSIRRLLQKNCLVDNQADLFSILEPNMDLSTNALPNVILSTPTHLGAEGGFLKKCEEISSGSNKHLSRFCSSSSTPLFSPPVLKPVKNRVLHEKYIDQLHCRDEKRKAESRKKEKGCSGKENQRLVEMQNIDVVKLAKNFLVANARDAISELQHLQVDPAVNSSDLEDDEVDVGDDDGDIEL